MNVSNFEVILPEPEQFGFCQGVEAAHRLLERVVDVANRNGVDEIFGYHAVVHNQSIIDHHENRGVVFVDTIEDVPERSIVVGSAHGSSPKVKYEVGLKQGLFVDGACALVTHTHKAATMARQNHEKLLYIHGGKLDHDEVKGMLGYINFRLDEKGSLVEDVLPHALLELSDSGSEMHNESLIEHVLDPSEKYRIIGQTTLLESNVRAFIEQIGTSVSSVQPDAVISRLDAKRQVCFAVEDRQNGVAVNLSERKPKTTVVVTDPSSKNGMSYVALAKRQGGDNHTVIPVAGPEELDLGMISPGSIFVTASASTPDNDTRAVVEKLGGDTSKIPFERPSFTIPSTTESDLERTINEWRGSF